MQTNFKRRIPVILLLLIVILSSSVLVSCKDDYFYDNKEPNFLGASIYDYLDKEGEYTYFLRLINDLGYKETLSRTGSKTLFPAKDEAFVRFFQNNPYGVKSYEELSYAQKREIMNVSMVNMAYLSYMLANVEGNNDGSGAGEGLALRRVTSSDYLDSISYVTDENLFASNSYWERFKSKGLYLIDNEAPRRIVHFTQSNMTKKEISAEDFSILNNGITYTDNDIYINGIKVIEKDIICKNGYIHVLENVMTPAKNMAQIIRDNGETNLFNKLMNKFCMPYYYENINKNVHDLYNGASPDRKLISDSVFVKRYFTESFNTDQTGKTLSNYGLLYYDPTDNAYSSQQDMGAMFVPTDAALNNYINGDKGRYLKDAYGSWENVPTTLLALFVKNHQKKSFINSLPHAWNTLTDESSFEMNVSKSDIKKTYIGSNGAVYISNSVYPPVDYQSVYASTMTSQSTKIMNWGIQNKDNTMKFFLYLRSMENMYNLIVPVDDAFQNYRDPISWAGSVSNREIWAFKYVPETDMVYADVYRANGNEKGEWLRELSKSSTHQDIIRNRLKDIIDMHIVVGEKDKATGQMWGYIDKDNIPYVQTKNGSVIKINGTGDNMTLTGGGDIEQNITPAKIVTNPQTGLKNSYDSDNGKTYFVDKILQYPVKSVYMALSEHPEYTAFFNLLKGDDRVFTYFQNDNDVIPIFSYKKTSGSSGLGYVVNSFNNFRYTVFVPTEQALNDAFASDSKLFTWDEIAAEEDYDLKKEKTLYLLKFLKYHFMDNSIFVNGQTFTNATYETAARNSSGKFHKLFISSTGDNLVITGENAAITSKVVKTTGLYNLMTRDCIVNSADYLKATKIESSSNAVIHLIDKALKFE